ncbi:MAG: TrkA family potassium uptake protein [Candidatus Omnitrophota bacterium]
MHIIIIGCGRVGAELAGLLASQGHNIVIVDKDPNSFNRLGAGFNGITLTGNGFTPDVLKQAGVEKADAFCAVTNGDNTNILASQMAKKIFNVPKVVTRIYDPQRAQIFKELGLDILSGTTLFASMIRDKIIENRLSSCLIETNQLGVMEIDVNDKMEGSSVSQLNVPDEFIVSAVIRDKNVIIPRPETIVDKGDKIIGVVKITSLNKIKKLF